MRSQILLSIVILALGIQAASAQVVIKVGKRGLEATLVDSDIAPITDGDPRVNDMRVPPDGSQRRFLVDTTGEMYVAAPDGSLSLYADFAVVYGDDLLNTDAIFHGFRSLAFHPEFATNGLFYTVHTEDADATGDDHAPVFQPPSIIGGAAPRADASLSVLVEWTATDPSANVFAGTRRELMRVETVGTYHAMSDIRFNNLAQPDDDDYGLLYIAIGDGESFRQGYAGNDPAKVNNLQRLDSYLGAMLRIDPLGSDGPNGLYGIPTSNPYANDGDPNTFGEIVAIGLRHPHRFVWDPTSGEMFIFDVGEGQVEEVNIFEIGANYGWPVREGSFGTGGIPLPADIADGTTPDGFTYPVMQFGHVDGRGDYADTAIAGGVPCRGCGVPAIEGKMVLGDIPSGRIFVADIDDMIAANDGVPSNYIVPEELQLIFNGKRTELLEVLQLALPGLLRADLRFALDESGTVYISNKHDGVMRTLKSGSRGP